MPECGLRGADGGGARRAAARQCHRGGVRGSVPRGHPRLPRGAARAERAQSALPRLGRDTARLAREFLDAGFQAIVATVDPRHLDASFAGRTYDASFLADLPPDVDPCGEHGEFHTFVHAGPVFDAPIPVETGEVVERDGFVYCDILPAGERAGADTAPVA